MLDKILETIYLCAGKFYFLGMYSAIYAFTNHAYLYELDLALNNP